MSKYVTVKYYAENQFTKESCQATGDSAGYDVFAAETKTFLPKAGVIDADFRGITQVLMINHHPENVFTVRTGNRIAQVVFMEKFNANFHRVSDLSGIC